LAKVLAEAPLDPAPTPARTSSRHVRWAAYAWGGLILVSLFVAAPLALSSIARQLIAPPEKSVYVISSPSRSGGAETPAAGHMRVTIAGIDDGKKNITLRLSGYRACLSGCPGFNVAFFALDDLVNERAGSPSATVQVADGARLINQTVELPVRGLPSLYPFDRYELILATSLSLEDPSRAAQLPGLLQSVAITLDSEDPRFILRPPDLSQAEGAPASELHPAFQRIVALHFVRPLHLQVLSILLVLLIAAAAVLSVTTEPLRRLVVGVGSVVLGVWGVRSILVADAPATITSVDLLLSGVILILLYGIAFRLLLVWRREGWDGLVHRIQDG
jgi:hypothetical protein